MKDNDLKTKWISTALMGSLALNLFVGGFLLSQALNTDNAEPEDMVFTADFSTLPVDMPKNIKEKVEDQMRDKRRELKRAYRKYSNQQQTINKLMAVDEVDEDDLRQAYEELAKLQIKIQEPIREAMITATRMMDRETREAIIKVRKRDLPARLIIPRKVDGSRWRIDLEEGDIDINIDINRLLEDNEAIQALAEEAARTAQEALREARKDYQDIVREAKQRHKETVRQAKEQYEEAKRLEKKQLRDSRKQRREAKERAARENRENKRSQNDRDKSNRESSKQERSYEHEPFQPTEDYLDQFDFSYRSDTHQNKR